MDGELGWTSDHLDFNLGLQWHHILSDQYVLPVSLITLSFSCFIYTMELSRHGLCISTCLPNAVHKAALILAVSSQHNCNIRNKKWLFLLLPLFAYWLWRVSGAELLHALHFKHAPSPCFLSRRYLRLQKQWTRGKETSTALRAPWFNFHVLLQVCLSGLRLIADDFF